MQQKHWHAESDSEQYDVGGSEPIAKPAADVAAEGVAKTRNRNDYPDGFQADAAQVDREKGKRHARDADQK